MPHEIEKNPSVATEPVVSAKLDELRDIGGEDFVVEVLETFVRDATTRVDLVTKAIETGDLATATREAHALKSACASVGAEAMRGVAALIEAAGRTGKLLPPMSAADLQAEFARVTAWHAAR